jgi:hypothetical protein
VKLKLLSHLLEKDRSDAVRYHSIQALGALSKSAKTAPVAVKLLKQAFFSETQPAFVRRTAADTLRMVSPEAIPVFVSGIRGNSDYVRRESVIQLRIMRDDAAPALDALIDCLRDRDPSVRTKAASAIGEIGRAAIGWLLPLLTDRDVHARIAAADAIVQTEPWHPYTRKIDQPDDPFCLKPVDYDKAKIHSAVHRAVEVLNGLLRAEDVGASEKVSVLDIFNSSCHFLGPPLDLLQQLTRCRDEAVREEAIRTLTSYNHRYKPKKRQRLIKPRGTNRPPDT